MIFETTRFESHGTSRLHNHHDYIRFYPNPTIRTARFDPARQNGLPVPTPVLRRECDSASPGPLGQDKMRAREAQAPEDAVVSILHCSAHSIRRRLHRPPSPLGGLARGPDPAARLFAGRSPPCRLRCAAIAPPAASISEATSACAFRRTQPMCLCLPGSYGSHRVV